MKLARALVAAALTLGAAAIIQLSTSSPASAHQQHHEMCGACWNVGTN